jgi:type II secretory pathway component PulJ
MNFKSEKGYTIAEALIAIQLAFIISGLTFAVYLFIMQLYGRWESKYYIEDTIRRSMDVISNDVRISEKISFASRDKIEIISKNKRIVYKVEDGKLLRNIQSINPSKVIVETIKFEYEYDKSRSKSDNFQNISLVRITLSFTSKKERFEISTAVKIRKNLDFIE